MRKLNWQITKFNSLHSFPADVPQGAAMFSQDMSNLRIDRWGHLRQRPPIRQLHVTAAPTTRIAGIDSSDEHIFYLQADSELFIVDKDTLQAQRIPHNLELHGRISVISDYRDYIMLTSEGTDQGIWVDLRDDKPLQAHKLGIDKPYDSAFSVTSIIPPSVTERTAFVVYAITYVRQFEAAIGEVQPDDLFNGTESELSEPVLFETVRAVREANAEQLIPGEWTWRIDANPNTVADGDADLDLNGSIALSYRDAVNTDHTQALNELHTSGNVKGINIVTEGGVRFEYEVANTAIAPDGNGIVFTIADRQFDYPDDGTIIFVSVDLVVDEIGGLKIDFSRDYYPAHISWDYPFDPQVTGINVYRSTFYRQPEGESDEPKDYERIRDLIRTNDPDLDLSTLQFRKIAYIAKNTTMGDLIEGVSIDNREDALSDLRPFKFRTIGQESREYYNWGGPDPIQKDQNNRLPANAESFTLHNDRLFAPHGNELRYSDLRNGVPFFNAFPPDNAIKVSDKIEFCASYRGALLFGGVDGLYTLQGDSKYNFVVRRIHARGPVSPFAWGIVGELLAFVGVDGLYMTDGAAVQQIGNELKGYFNRYQIEDGVVGELTGDASLWGVTRRSSTGALDTLHFINEQGRWTRLDTNPIQQVAHIPIRGQETTLVADHQLTPRILNWIVEYETSVDNDDGDPIRWRWESQQLDWNEQGIGERMKNFKWLEISGLAVPPEITITFYIDDKEPIVITKNLDRELTDRFKPLRVRINRWGYALRFAIGGAGDIALRGLKLLIHT